MTRLLKDTLYEQFARIGQAVASPKRLELLDLLGQGEKDVETLAAQSAMPLKNTSAHLRVLRHARLVESRREGTYIHYRLADDSVVHLLRAIQTLGQTRLAEVEQVTQLYLTRRDELEPVSIKELRRLMRTGEVTVVDVRPKDEYEAGHIPGALSIPLSELKGRLAKLPKSKEIIAYCRGPYCVYSLEAITLLRKNGYRARRAQEGIPAWRASRLPIAAGA